MKVKFCGAARNVTGSAHLITLDNGYKILLDCGLYQGRREGMDDFNRSWYFAPQDIDCLILSHAHIDHSGRIPRLVKDGFEGLIYSTHATRSLCAIMLLDSARIQERDAEYYNRKMLKKRKSKKNKKKFALREPLYTGKEVHETMDRFVGVPYNEWFRINDRVEFQFRDAGHILGSASVSLKIKEGGREISFGFTGDIGRPDRPILRDPKLMPPMDYLICESTYGDKDHEAPPAEIEKFLGIIKKTCIEKKGKLIIPAFSVGRTQEIVYMLDQLESSGKLPHIPVYVDSPLAVNATTVFGAHPECFDNDLNEYMLVDDNPFGFNTLSYIREVAASKALNNSQEASIIISSSGMMNAGRVRHHLYNSIDHPKNTILIVGYCSPDTAGGMLRDGIDKLKLFGDWKMVKADIEIMDSFSAHADRNEIIGFLHNQKAGLKRLFLVHGEIDRQENFKTLLAKSGFNDVEIPKLGDEFELS